MDVSFNVRRASKAAIRAIFAVAILSTSCAYAPRERIALTATDYNLAVEESNNKMLLLNVLRAKDRKPMYFTSVSALRGSISTQVSSGPAEIPFGGSAEPKFNLAPGVVFSTNPQFDVGVLDSEKFYRGILSAATPETIGYYFDQGWPNEMLLHLFVRTIEIGEKRFVNYPERPLQVLAFQKIARLVFNCEPSEHSVNCDFQVLRKESETNSIHENPTVPVQTVQDILALDSSSYIYTLKGNNVVSLKKRALTWIDYAPSVSANQREELLEEDRMIRTVCKGADGRVSFALFPSASSQDLKDAPKCKIHLRSPEAMLYYLGEIARIQLNDQARAEWIGACSQEKSCINWPKTSPNVYVRLREACVMPLFRVQEKGRSAESSEAETAVDYRGSRYYVPSTPMSTDGRSECSADRSMHVLSLVHQVLSLQKSKEDLPVTPTVNVIGDQPK